MTTSGTQQTSAGWADSPSEQESLEDYLARTGRLPLLQGLALALQLLADLDASHRRGLDARPISIAGLRISRTGRLLVHLPADAAAQTRPRAPCSQRQVQSDLRAAAAVVEELLTGRSPKADSGRDGLRTADSSAGAMRGRAGLSVALDAVFARALSAQAEDRYRSAAEFAAALQAAMPQPRWDRSVCEGPELRQVPAPLHAADIVRDRACARSQQPPRARRSRRLGLVLASGAAVAVIAVALATGLGGLWQSTTSAVSTGSNGTDLGQDAGRMQVAEQASVPLPVAPKPVESLTAEPEAAAPPSPAISVSRLEAGPAAPVERRTSAASARVRAITGDFDARHPVRPHRTARRKADQVTHALAPGPEAACRKDFALAPELCTAFRCATSEFRQHPVCVRMHAEGARARAQLAESRGGP